MSDRMELARRLVIGHKSDDRSRYDEPAKAELVAEWAKPGASVPRLAEQARRDAVDAPELQRRRQEHSAPVLADIEDLLLDNLHTVLPKSLLGQALHYLASQWGKLKPYVDDGRYIIDNTPRKTRSARYASANLYSLRLSVG